MTATYNVLYMSLSSLLRRVSVECVLGHRSKYKLSWRHAKNSRAIPGEFRGTGP